MVQKQEDGPKKAPIRYFNNPRIPESMSLRSEHVDLSVLLMPNEM